MFSNRFQPGPPCSQECWLGTNEAPYLKGDKIEVSKLKGFLLKQLQLCSWSHFLHPFFHCKISRQLGPSPHHWQVQWRERHRQAPKHLTFHKHDDNSRRPNQPNQQATQFLKMVKRKRSTFLKNWATCCPTCPTCILAYFFFSYQYCCQVAAPLITPRQVLCHLTSPTWTATGMWQ